MKIDRIHIAIVSNGRSRLSLFEMITVRSYED